MTALLEVGAVSYTYPRHRREVLHELTLDVREGEFVSLVGPSGCGKSTLVSAVAGLLPGYQGSIRFRGQPIDRPHPQVGVVFQEDSTFPWRTANLFSDVQNRSIRLLTSLSSYPAYKNVAVRVIFGSGSYIKSHPVQVREFLTAWHEAWSFAFANHTKALTDWRNGAKLSEPVTVLATGFSYYTPTTQRLLPLDGLQQDISDAVALGVLKAPLTASQLAGDVETRYAASASSSG